MREPIHAAVWPPHAHAARSLRPRAARHPSHPPPPPARPPIPRPPPRGGTLRSRTSFSRPPHPFLFGPQITRGPADAPRWQSGPPGCAARWVGAMYVIKRDGRQVRGLRRRGTALRAAAPHRAARSRRRRGRHRAPAAPGMPAHAWAAAASGPRGRRGRGGPWAGGPPRTPRATALGKQPQGRGLRPVERQQWPPRRQQGQPVTAPPAPPSPHAARARAPAPARRAAPVTSRLPRRPAGPRPPPRHTPPPPPRNKVPVRFDKITARIKKLAYGLDPNYCDPVRRWGARRRTARPDCSRAAPLPPTRPVRAPAGPSPAGPSSVGPPPALPQPRASLTACTHAPSPPPSAGAGRPEDRGGRVQGRHHDRARRARGGDGGGADVKPPRLRHGGAGWGGGAAPRVLRATKRRRPQRLLSRSRQRGAC
jgi:hypothetical protein